MPPGITFIALWVIGLLGGYFVLRWLLRRITGTNYTLGDITQNYGRGFGDYNWQQWNERQPGEAEKHKSQEYGGLPRQTTSRRAAPNPTKRLQATEPDDAETVSLSELLSDEQREQDRT